MSGGWWVLTILVIGLATFLLWDLTRMTRMQSQIRRAYMEDGLSYDQANNVAWYLVDVFIYLRKRKDPTLARMVVGSTMAIYKQRLFRNEVYSKYHAAKIQFDALRDARLIFNRPVPETAELIYSSIVASFNRYMEKE